MTLHATHHVCCDAGKAVVPASCSTAKLTILGMQLRLGSGLNQHAKLQVGDVILIMQSAPASSSHRLGCRGLQASSMDLTLAAVSLTAYSVGMLILSLTNAAKVAEATVVSSHWRCCVVRYASVIV